MQAHCTASPEQQHPSLPLPSCIFTSRPLLPDDSGIPALSLPGLDLTAGLTAAIPGNTQGDGGALLWVVWQCGLAILKGCCLGGM